MKLANIALGKLCVSPLNMRYGKTAPDVSDILPSVRARGVLVPVIVRPVPVPPTGETAPDALAPGSQTPQDGAFEIVAGSRRFHAARIVAEETGEAEPLPCAILEDGDDAAALEASLIENIARLDPDEVAQWETFTRLVKEGRSAEQIGQTFGLTDLYVRRILALGNLHPRLRALYRSEEIDIPTIRHLTLATKAQQKDWLKLFDSDDDCAPTRAQLKAWLFGGAEISTRAALFDLAAYKGRIVSDLFGENGYFEDAHRFWEAQGEAIAAKRDALLAQGWTAVEVMDTGERFRAWEYEHIPMAQGGRVYISVSHRGEVEIHEGYLTGKEAKKVRAAETKSPRTEEEKQAALAGKPETSGPLQTYIDLHRHAAARACLLDHPAISLRLMVAHAISGSPLWAIRIEDQNARNEATAESLAQSASEQRFNEARRAVLALLGFDTDSETVVWRDSNDRATAAVFARLLTLADSEVMAVIGVVMGETLMAGSAMVEAAGNHIGVDMTALWSPDEAFFTLVRDRPTVNLLLRDIGGKRAADGNLAETAKTQKAVIRDFLAGTNNRKKVDNWTPKWLLFPAASYSARGFPTLARWKVIEKLFRGLPAPDPMPATPMPAAPDNDPGSAEPFAVAAE